MAVTSGFVLIQRNVRNVNNMDGLRQRKYLYLSLIILFISIVFFRDFIKSISRSFIKDGNVLIIGILSSPDNFQKRLSIRNTWLKLTTELSVSYYFVIGEKFCMNHPLDRISSYSCKETSLSIPENAEVTKFSTIKKVPENKVTNSLELRCIGFGFQTLHDVNVKELGVLTSFINLYKDDVRIKLVSPDSKTVLASVLIPYNHGSKNDSDFILMPLDNLTMRRGSEVQVLMELSYKNISYLASCEDFEWNFSPGVINYLQIFQAGFRKPWPFHANSCSYVLMTYEIADLDSLKDRVKEREKRQKEWEKYKKNLTVQLKNESKTFGDITFVNVVDVYENLPRKLIQFLKRIMDTEQFDFVLKTDDDTFIDVLRVFKKVSEMKDNSLGNDLTEKHKFWWWSDFRESWKVQESGKWREDKYRSPAYPSFPCGGGYILSRGIVSYLSANHNNLQYFQGEDVSVGIWLSGLTTVQCTTPSVSKWKRDWIQENIVKRFGGESAWFKYKRNQNKLVRDICDWTCEREVYYEIPLCNRVQLSVSEMYATWNDYILYGFIQ